MKPITSLFLLFSLTAPLASTVQAAGSVPYYRIAQAAASEESVMSQAQSTLLAGQWKAALLAQKGLGSLTIKTNVYMGRGFASGFVNSKSEQKQIVKISKSMPLRSVDLYLPIRTASTIESYADLSAKASGTTTAFLVKQSIKQALRSKSVGETLKISISVLDGAAVLTGIVGDKAEHDLVVSAASKTKGVNKVVDFLLLPEAGLEKRIKPNILKNRPLFGRLQS